MKYLSIDGDRRITCPDSSYLADYDPKERCIIIWNPNLKDIPIRVSVLTLEPVDTSILNAGFSEVKGNDREGSIKILDDKAICRYSNPGYPNTIFYEVGLGNHICLFSIYQERGKAGFEEVQKDLESMIDSLVARKPGEIFICELLECLQLQVKEAAQELLPEDRDQVWTTLESHYELARQMESIDLVRKIGLAFGELLIEQVNSFHWKFKIDDAGPMRCLVFGQESIFIHPEVMIFKRFNRQERIDFEHMADRTIDAVEAMYLDKYDKGM